MTDNRQRNNGKKGASPIDPNFAHVQPQAVEIERVVLGALMVDSDAFSVVSELLKPETFYEPRHQKIYEAIRNMNMDERPVDIMTLNDELSKMGEIDKVGGVDYLMEISSQVASAAHVESHARILAEKKSSNVTFIILSTDYWWNWLIKYMKNRAKEDLQLLSPAF